MRAFVVCLALYSLSIGPLRAAVVEKGPAGLENFQALAASSWELRCENAELLRADPSLMVRARRELLSAIEAGLRRIAAVNPRLVEAALAQATGRKLVIECAKDAEAYQVAGFGEYRRGRIKTTGAFLALLPPGARIYGRQLTAEQLAFYRQDGFNILIHELLHALNLDNLKLAVHHDPKRPSREDDVIFACAAQAYPSDAVYVDVPACYPGCTGKWPRYANTRKACETCAAARLIKGKAVVVTANEASAACGAVESSSFKLQ